MMSESFSYDNACVTLLSHSNCQWMADLLDKLPSSSISGWTSYDEKLTLSISNRSSTSEGGLYPRTMFRQ